MATRHNLCLNPALKVNTTGWAGGSTPTRVTSLTGFPRTTGAHYTSGTFQVVAGPTSGTITAGLAYTVSLYIRCATFSQANKDLLIEWLNSGGGTVSESSTKFSLTFDVISRISITGTAPVGAVGMQIVVDGINASVSNLDITAVLIEQTSSLDTYFDGDTSGASWDGTDGNSASTLTDSATVTVAGGAGRLSIRPSSGAVATSHVLLGGGGAVRVRAGSGGVQAAQGAPLSGAGGAVRLRGGQGAVLAVRVAPQVGSAGSVRLKASTGAVTAVRVAPQVSAAGVMRLRPGAGLVVPVANVQVAGAAGTVRLRSSPGQIISGVTANLIGTPGVMRFAAGSGRVLTVQNRTAVGPAGRLILRAGSGAVQAVASGTAVTVAGRSGVLLLRPGAGAVTGVVPEPVIGPGGVMNARQRQTADMTVGEQVGAGMTARVRVGATMGGS